MASNMVLALVLAVSFVLAQADPNVLQGLYQAPHDHNEHHAEHTSTAEHSATSDVELVSTSQTGNVAVSSGSTSGSGSVSRELTGDSGVQRSANIVVAPESLVSSSEASVQRSESHPLFIQPAVAGSTVSSGRSSETTGGVRSAGTIDSVRSGSPVGNDGRNIVTGTSRRVTDAAPFILSGQFDPTLLEDITITSKVTVDIMSTITDLFYNTVPVTLTEFFKTTLIAPTLQVLTTPVDDKVFIARSPFTRTDTVTVTDTNTVAQCVTEVSTDVYTVTHRAYDIQQQVVTSTLVQTQTFQPTIVSTRILTEYETSTVSHTITNTVIVQPRPDVTTSFDLRSSRSSTGNTVSTSAAAAAAAAQSTENLRKMADELTERILGNQEILINEAVSMTLEQQQQLSTLLLDAVVPILSTDSLKHEIINAQRTFSLEKLVEYLLKSLDIQRLQAELIDSVNRPEEPRLRYLHPNRR